MRSKSVRANWQRRRSEYRGSGEKAKKKVLGRAGRHTLYCLESQNRGQSDQQGQMLSKVKTRTKNIYKRLNNTDISLIMDLLQ